MSPDVHVQIDADLGDRLPVDGAFSDRALRWARGDVLTPTTRDQLGPPADPSAWDWRDPQIGWGVVLPLPDDGSVQPRARDQPQVVQDLIARRGREIYSEDVPAPVLRFDPSLPPGQLRRDRLDGQASQVIVGHNPDGKNSVPLFLLILGGPAQIPWWKQYELAQLHRVGRLALDGDGLGNYLTALADDFSGCATNSLAATVFTTSTDTVTSEIRKTVAEPLLKELRSNPQMAPGLDALEDDAAVLVSLRTSLGRNPGLVVTCGHGRTAPLEEDGRDDLRATMGLPVDTDGAALGVVTAGADATEVDLSGFVPEGAVWYAHGCCTAGARHDSELALLFEEGSRLERTLTAVAGAGSMVAPLPTALLGAAKPIRTFVGQVEPTFDWTLRVAETGQRRTVPIVKALWNKLFNFRPVGYAFDDYFDHVGAEYATVRRLEHGARRDDEIAKQRLRARLTALDLESTVILGDPTAALPGWPADPVR